MRAQAYLIAVLLAILIMASIVTLTKPIYVDSVIKPIYKTLIHAQTDINNQIFYILLGVQAMVSQNESYWNEIAEKIDPRSPSDPDVGDDLDSNTIPYYKIANNTLAEILDQLDVINNSYNMPLIEHNLVDSISPTSRIFVSSKREASDPFIRGKAYGIGVSTIESNGKYKVERTVDILYFKISSGSLSIGDAYIYINFTNIYKLYIHSRVVHEYKSVIVKNVSIRINGRDELPENKYKVFMDPEHGFFSMTIGISILDIINNPDRPMYLYINIICGHNDIIRILVWLYT